MSKMSLHKGDNIVSVREATRSEYMNLSVD